MFKVLALTSQNEILGINTRWFQLDQTDLNKKYAKLKWCRVDENGKEHNAQTTIHKLTVDGIEIRFEEVFLLGADK